MLTGEAARWKRENQAGKVLYKKNAGFQQRVIAWAALSAPLVL
jgi:hypothetical protein